MVDAKLDVLGQQINKSFAVSNINLENIGGAEGISISELTNTLFKSLMSKASSSGKSAFPELYNVDINQIKDEKIDEVKTDISDKVKDLGNSLLKK